MTIFHISKSKQRDFVTVSPYGLPEHAPKKTILQTNFTYIIFYAILLLKIKLFMCISWLDWQESHIHSLMNVLRYCNLDESLQGEEGLVCRSALGRLYNTKELDYMSYIVLRMFENTEVSFCACVCFVSRTNVDSKGWNTKLHSPTIETNGWRCV